jgi:hypothetical protein
MAQLPFPELISLKRWSNEVLTVYKNERLPILTDENNWQEWANIVAGSGIFRRNSVPSATSVKYTGKMSSYKDWKAWAKAFYIIMINAR